LNTYPRQEAEPKPQIQPKEPRTLPFDAKAYAQYDSVGTATITGQAFLTTRGGDVKVGAGRKIGLIPVTNISRRWFNGQFIRQIAVVQGRVIREGIGGIPLSMPEPDDQGEAEFVPSDRRILKYNRTTTGDGDGRFRFEQVPSGRYYLVCHITWMVGYGESGGMVQAEVEIKDGETKNIILTPLVD